MLLLMLSRAFHTQMTVRFSCVCSDKGKGGLIWPKLGNNNVKVVAVAVVFKKSSMTLKLHHILKSYVFKTRI